MLNLAYVPECLILPGRGEQWNWGAIEASPAAFEKRLAEVMNYCTDMVNRC